MAVQSKKQLKDYCLRKLGSPVINIEVDDMQLNDRVDEAIEKFIFGHFDGSDEFASKITITKNDDLNGYIKMPENIIAVTKILTPNDKSNVEVMDDLDYNIYMEINSNTINYGMLTDIFMKKEWLSSVQDMFVVQHNYDFNASSNNFIHHEKPNLAGLYTKLEAIVPTNATYNQSAAYYKNDQQIADSIVCSSNGDYSISTKYITRWYPRGIYTIDFNSMSPNTDKNLVINVTDRNGSAIYSEVIVSTQQWVNHKVEFTIPTTAINDINVEIKVVGGLATDEFYTAGLSMYKNNFIVIQGYKQIDYENSENIYNNEWLKRYSCALIKQQWGSNLKKFTGVQLPGGVEMNGQVIWDEATQELDKLDEEFISTYQEPLGIYTG